MAVATATAVALFGGTTRVISAATGSSSSSSPPFLVLPTTLPSLPRRSALSSSVLPESRKFSSLQLRVSSSDETSGSTDVNDFLADLQQKWDGLENKSTVLVYGGGAVVAVWLSTIVIGAVNSVPLLPKIMELVGLGYTGWFVYRYLLFKSNRKELACEIEELKKKIAGTSE